MTTTPNMLLVLPALGGSTGVWDDLTQTIHEQIDLHDHATGKGVKVTPSGLNINTDLSLIGTSSLINTKAVQFTAAASYTVARSLFVLSSDNELYWRTNGGTNVKITSGNTLNLSLVGGIYGDYSSTSAKIYYEDAGKRYKMLQSGPAPDFWASVDCGDLKLYEKASAISNAVTLKSPATLAASYSLTMPAAVPAATALVQSSTTGVLSFNVTANRAPMFATTFEANGVVSLGTLVGAFTATGAITATSFIFTVGLDLAIPASKAAYVGAHTFTNSDMDELELLAIATGVNFPIELPSACRILAFAFHYRKTTDNTKTLTCTLEKTIAGVTTVEQTISTSANNPGISSTTSGAFTEAISSSEFWRVKIVGSGTTGDTVFGVRIFYDKNA